ncbi:MAG: transposase, partial [candidate division WOR-3 bacterium]
MQAELVGYLRARPHERVKERRDYRNGSYKRDLTTRYGLIRFLSVPRARRCGFRTRVFQRYKRRLPVIDEYLCKLFIEGVSTREVGAVVSELLGTKPSATVVSNVSKVLNEEVRRFHCRRIADGYLYLFLDGIWVKINGYKVVKKVLLIAYGIRRDGVREVIGFRLAKSESERDWEVFLQDLYRRGLEGKYLRLITIDGGKGLRGALE